MLSIRYAQVQLGTLVCRTHHGVPINLISDGLKFPGKGLLPTAPTIELLIDDTTEIRWQFHIAFLKSADVFPP